MKKGSHYVYSTRKVAKYKDEDARMNRRDKPLTVATTANTGLGGNAGVGVGVNVGGGPYRFGHRAPSVHSEYAPDLREDVSVVSLAHSDSPLTRKNRAGSRGSSESGSRMRSNSHNARPDGIQRLHLSRALLQSDRITVTQCVKGMLKEKTDAALLVNAQGLLTGVFTDKDLAHRVVAVAKDPNFTVVCDVMTRNPRFVTSTASVLDALKVMTTANFSHLPVTENDRVVGVLDLSKCLNEAIMKVEQESNGSASSLADALKKLQKRIPGGRESVLERLRDQILMPTLSMLVPERQTVPILGMSATAKDAASLMLTVKSSAVIVCDDREGMVGIFTSKDLMRRIVAWDLTPAKCLLANVMTKNPISVRVSTTLLETVQAMQRGRFLHMPVFDDNVKLVALIDGLSATRAIFQQMATLRLTANDNLEPLWKEIQQNYLRAGLKGSDIIDEDDEELDRDSSSTSGSGSGSESGDDSSDVSSSSSGKDSDENEDSDEQEPPEDTSPQELFVFKLADASGANHRFSSSASSLQQLIKDVQNRLGDSSIRKVQYVDEDGDKVLLFKDKDLKDAVRRARSSGNKYIRLVVLQNASKSSGRRPALVQGNDMLLIYASVAIVIAGVTFFLARRR